MGNSAQDPPIRSPVVSEPEILPRRADRQSRREPVHWTDRVALSVVLTVAPLGIASLGHLLCGPIESYTTPHPMVPAVPESTVSPSHASIVSELSRLTVGTDTGFRFQRAQTISDGHGGTLTAVVGIWRGTGDGYGAQIVGLYHDDAWLGATTYATVQSPSIATNATATAFEVLCLGWPSSLPPQKWSDFNITDRVTVQ